MKFNAFCTDFSILGAYDRMNLCGAINVNADKRINVFAEFYPNVEGNIYIPTMCDEDMFADACDYILSGGGSRRAIVRCAYSLDETGYIEAKYKLSPVMLLHKLGMLDKVEIAGGVCLDNDDLDLMAQEGVPLIVTPTASAGYGHGFAPVCAAVRRGVRVGVGTFDNKYNTQCDLGIELEFLRLTANAEMRAENALSESELKFISAYEI